MNVLTDFGSHEAVSALGWTLIHSLWQALAILVVVKLVLRCVPLRQSDTRYVISCGAFFLMAGLSVVTFASLYSTPFDPRITETAEIFLVINEQAQAARLTVADRVSFAINQSMPWLVGAWGLGLALSSLRFVGGLMYAQRLRTSAQPLENEWSEYITSTCDSLGIKRVVSLAESAKITAPVVIGYLKPVILTPMGMLAGLSAEQVETILLHEIAHVKRHDYLINLCQTAIETAFFFNPFVWILSGMIRREREYCCDDLVVRRHRSARAYAFALARLEEQRLSGHAFALSLADDRNQLLNRIRRIMETSTKRYSPKQRALVPALLLVVGLSSISWLGIRHGIEEPTEAAASVDQDTVIHDRKEKGARYTRKSIITIDENGQPHEEIVEEFEGDESLRPMMEKHLPDPMSPAPVLPPKPPKSAPPVPDTIPVPFAFPDREQWDAFAKRFDEQFRLQTEEFFSRPGNPFEMLEEFNERFEINGLHGWDSLFESFPDAFENHIFTDSLGGMNDLLQRLEKFNKGADKFEFLTPMHGWRLPEADLRQQLMEDGYLSKGEAIESMEWNNEEFKVNGKKIREADAEKYRRLFNHHSDGKVD